MCIRDRGLTSECVTLGAGRNKLSPDGYHGGFGCSEYVIKPYRSLFKLNQNMDPSEAAFVEPVGTVCQGIRKLRVQPVSYTHLLFNSKLSKDSIFKDCSCV